MTTLALCAAFVIALWLINDFMTDRDSKELT